MTLVLGGELRRAQGPEPAATIGNGSDGAYHAPMRIPAPVVRLIDSAPIAHVVTLNADGSPHLSLAWVGIEDDEVVIGTLPEQPKLRNIRRDPRVAISMVTGRRNEPY